MKNTAHKRVLTMSIAIFAFCLTACSNSSKPSDEEVKDAVTAMIGNCNLIKVKEFHKNNGIPQQDGSYLEDVSYRLVFKPDSDMMQIFSPLIQEIADEHQKAPTARITLKKFRDAEDAFNQSKDYSSAVHDGVLDVGQSNRIEALRYYDTLSPEEQNTYTQAEHEADEPAFIENLRQQAMTRLTADFTQACPDSPVSVRSTFLFDLMNLADASGEVSRDNNNFKFQMIKTDNGWIAGTSQ